MPRMALVAQFAALRDETDSSGPATGRRSVVAGSPGPNLLSRIVVGAVGGAVVGAVVGAVGGALAVALLAVLAVMRVERRAKQAGGGLGLATVTDNWFGHSVLSI